MLHPIFASIYPPVLICCCVQTCIFVHSTVNEVLFKKILTSVNFPLMPVWLLAGTNSIHDYVWIRVPRSSEPSFCKRSLQVWPEILHLRCSAECLTFTTKIINVICFRFINHSRITTTLLPSYPVSIFQSSISKNLLACSCSSW